MAKVCLRWLSSGVGDDSGRRGDWRDRQPSSSSLSLSLPIVRLWRHCSWTCGGVGAGVDDVEAADELLSDPQPEEVDVRPKLAAVDSDAIIGTEDDDCEFWSAYDGR